ncbi:MAG: hypothetical protein ABIH03_13635 [Pseudomonadota bacterium]
MAAGDAVVKGTNDFTEQPSYRRWTDGEGWSTIRTWEGPQDTTKIDAVVVIAKAAGATSVDVRRGHPTAIIAAVPDSTAVTAFGGFDDDSEEWDLTPYDLSKTLGSHGYFLQTGVDAPAKLAAIDALVKKGDSAGNYESAEFTAYARLREIGVESYTTFGYSLRRTVNLDRASEFVRTMQQNSENRGRVISWDQINVPQSARIEKPWARLYGWETASLPAAALRSGSGTGWSDYYFDEWLVKPPAIRFVKQGRVRRRQFTQEFLGAIQWSRSLYDGGTGYP